MIDETRQPNANSQQQTSTEMPIFAGLFSTGAALITASSEVDSVAG
jgi:hypothetical protein